MSLAPMVAVDVPEKIIDLAKQFPIFCNLREDQWSEDEFEEKLPQLPWTSETMVTGEVVDVLRKITFPQRMVILVQLTEKNVETAVIDVEEVRWLQEYQYPGLKLKGIVLWIGFVLAFGFVDENIPTTKASGEELFLEMVPHFLQIAA